MQQEYKELKDILNGLESENLTNEDIDNITTTAIELIINAKSKSQRKLFSFLQAMMKDLETSNYPQYIQLEKSINEKKKQSSAPKTSM